MATTQAMAPPQAKGVKEGEDPFVTTPPNRDHPTRFSRFDSQLFALNPSTSPTQAKRALEAHLAETERRIQDASRLGTTLVDQRKALIGQLKEVEKRKEESEIGPELRQKLIDLEKEYNEVGRETARAFLAPKAARLSQIEGAPSPYSDAKQGSPAVFASDATNSPSKVTVPSRSQRNQVPNKVQDIEFATQISTSLLAQVKHLQNALAERESSIRTLNEDKSLLEVEVEGQGKRIRHLTETEERYKDENWNLESKNRDLVSTAKESSEREIKLTQALTAASGQKSTIQKELDELKQQSAKLSEEHAASKKHHESELAGLRRTVTQHESQKSALEGKVLQLTSHNEELAKAVAGGRARAMEADQVASSTEEQYESALDKTPDNSPPGSPSKNTPRNSMLETETLKSSLGHAHRMIQNLKGTIHREKTEKVELKRMLQEVRDELEQRRSDGMMPGSGAKKKRNDKDIFKKPARPGALGAARTSQTELLDDDWEDQEARQAMPGGYQSVTDTQTETSDAFETANEKDGTDDNFITGAESMANSDEDTETEGTSKVKANSSRPSLVSYKAGNRQSFMSTASTSGDEAELKTPLQPRFRRSQGARSAKSAVLAEEDFKDSPASFASNDSSVGGTPQGQSLFAELGDMDEDFDELEEGTPSRVGSKFDSTPATAKSTPKALGAPFKADMADAGTMTDEPYPEPRLEVAAEPEHKEEKAGLVGAALGALAGAGGAAAVLHSEPEKTLPKMVDSDAQYDIVAPQMAHAEAQHEQPAFVHAESQYDVRPVAHAEVQHDRAAGVDAEVQPEQRTFAHSEAQYDIPAVSHAEVQHDIPSVVHAEVQHNVPAVAHAEVQHDVPVMSHAEVQHESSMDEKLVPLPLVVTSKDLASQMSFSTIDSQETEPLPQPEARQSLPAPPVPDRAVARAGDDSENKPGMFGGLLGWARPQTQIAEDDTTTQSRQVSSSSQDSSMPLRPISDNVGPREKEVVKPVLADSEAQTAVSWDYFENLQKGKQKAAVVTTPAHGAVPTVLLDDDPFVSSGVSAGAGLKKSSESLGSVARARARMADPAFAREEAAGPKPIKRSGSSGSNRSSIRAYPPLPPDHKETIAAAQQRVVSGEGTPSTLMGPPLAPASAYRTNQQRPKTPTGQLSSPTRSNATTPRAKAIAGRSEVSSPAFTGRSSISSFTSDIENRFNTQALLPGGPNGIDSNTDPRLIEAITQTMIGEYLWKYTRKAGRGQLSTNRHQRFFWVHPYTRTLYWSDRDPAVGSKAEHKAKSVAIEAVRVVTDDNPYPPGLHRKSIVIITPGRSIKFTAPTGQRHETWFNALSYLILRTTPATRDGAEEGITQEDIDEFDPYHHAKQQSTARRAPSNRSMDSRASRASRQSVNRAPSSLAYRPPVLQSSPKQEQPSVSKQGSISRLSNMLRPASFSSRRSRQSVSASASVYAGSDLHDSAEDLRAVIERQERDSARLENVRACCDGKHDVGSLNRRNGRTSALSVRSDDHHHHHHH